MAEDRLPLVERCAHRARDDGAIESRGLHGLVRADRGLELVTSGVSSPERIEQRGQGTTLGDGLGEPRDLAFDPLELRAALTKILRAARRREGREQAIDNRLFHLGPEVLVQFPKHRIIEGGDRFLQPVATHRGAALVIRDAAILPSVEHAEAAAALGAARKTGEQIA